MAAPTSTEPQPAPRLSPAQRIERLVVTTSLLGLALTGLPQRFAEESWARTLIVLGGGIESMRILHRFFAILLIAEAIYHVLALGYRQFVYGQRLVMFPGIRDWRSLVMQIGENLGLKRAGDTPPNYHFALKLEYLVILLGVIVLGVTGLMLWNPIATTTLLPGEAIPVVHSVHSDHALFTAAAVFLLRLGIVFLWRPRRAEIFAESAGEQVPLSPAQTAARRRRFLPAALALAGAAVVALVLFLTSEQTAIDTVPRQRAVIFAPQVMPESGDPNIGAVLWETMRCAFCHGPQAEGGPRGGPSLRRPDLTFEAFYRQVRVGRGDMPAFTHEELPDGYLTHLWAWLKQPEA